MTWPTYDDADFYNDPPKGELRVRTLIMIPSDMMHQFGGVIVMGWDHVVPRNSRAGSKYRKYCAEFTEAERKALGTWHTRLYTWELRTGYPIEVGMKTSTLDLLNRAANFFVSV